MSEQSYSTSKLILAHVKENFVAYALMAAIVIIIIVIVAYYARTQNLMNSQCSYVDSLFSTLDGSIKSLNPSDPNCQYNLNDYYIKTAYNCCSPGAFKNDYVSTCVLKDLLKQGVRGFDFEIFSVDNQPVVATSTSDSVYVKETYNDVPFSDVMTIITNYAFASSSAPNPQDPIFFHFRFKSNNMPMYENLAALFKSYDSFFLGAEYSYEDNGNNFGNTPLLQLAGKIIVVVDKMNTTFLDCTDFYEYVNMTSNSIFMRALNYYDVQNTPDLSELQTYNKTNMTIAMPDTAVSPPNPSAIVCRETGAQMVAMMYQKNDTNLQENNVFFDQAGYAFALKPEALRYVPQVVENPPPQDPALSYQARTVSSDYYSFSI
jgi:hypothetical protein